MSNPYVQLEERMEDLRELMKLRKDSVPQFERLFELSWIHHDNALEGIVITAKEMEDALNPIPVSPGDTSTAQIFREVRNYKAAIDFVREEAAAKKNGFTLPLIKKLYEMLGQGFASRDKAVFRKDMPLHRTYFHEIHQPAKIADALDRVLQRTTTTEFKESHPIKQATQLHHEFMQVFPFTENSGKVARLLSNLILLRNGSLPAVIHAIDRQRYYEALKQAAPSLRNIYVEALENSLDNAFKFFENAPRLSKAAGR